MNSVRKLLLCLEKNTGQKYFQIFSRVYGFAFIARAKKH